MEQDQRSFPSRKETPGRPPWKEQPYDAQCDPVLAGHRDPLA